jgi:hypothetical protein
VRRRHRTAGPLAVREERAFDAAASRVRKAVTVTAADGSEAAAAALGCPPDGLRYVEDVMVFTLGELDAMALAAGLERVAAAGGYDGEPLGAGDRWLLAYRRQAVP